MTTVTYMVDDTGINLAEKAVLTEGLEEAVTGSRLLHAIRMLPLYAATHTQRRERAMVAFDD